MNTDVKENTPSKPDVKHVVCANKESYQKSRTSAGKPSLNCGDEVASAVSGLTLDNKYVVASKILKVPEADLRAKYEHLNTGMQGMNLGNRIRGAVTKDEKSETPVGLMKILITMTKPAQQAIEAAAAKSKAESEKKAT